jgi:uncharacterized damage-inducible protein DinB
MDLATVKALFRYNAWANEQVLGAVSRIPREALSHPLHPRPEGSIQGVLTHIVWSEWIWLQRWTGVTRLVFQPADFGKVPGGLVFSADDFPDVESFRRRFATVATDTAAYLDGLEAGELDRPLELLTPNGDRWALPLWRQLVHAVNHSSYHRGQVAVMLRERGFAPAPSDFVGFDDPAF